MGGSVKRMDDMVKMTAQRAFAGHDVLATSLSTEGYMDGEMKQLDFNSTMILACCR